MLVATLAPLTLTNWAKAAQVQRQRRPSSKLLEVLVEEPPTVRDKAQILYLGPNRYEDRVDHD